MSKIIEGDFARRFKKLFFEELLYIIVVVPCLYERRTYPEFVLTIACSWIGSK